MRCYCIARQMFNDPLPGSHRVLPGLISGKALRRNNEQRGRRIKVQVSPEPGPEFLLLFGMPKIVR